MGVIGDPAWWQAVAALLQGAVAIALLCLTRKYVNLTDNLVKLQADVVTLQSNAVRRELYERRLKVYDCTMALLARFARDVRVEFADIQTFFRDTREAEFLFDRDVVAFLEQVVKNLNEHWQLREDTEDQARLNSRNKLELWLVSTAFDEAKGVFGRYLRVTENPAQDRSNFRVCRLRSPGVKYIGGFGVPALEEWRNLVTAFDIILLLPRMFDLRASDADLHHSRIFL